MLAHACSSGAKFGAFSATNEAEGPAVVFLRLRFPAQASKIQIMPDLQSAPPPTLLEAVQLFAEYLASNGYPTRIRWITPDQILQGEDGKYLVHAVSNEDAKAQSEAQYNAGLMAGFGILLQALCAAGTETIAEIYIPSDEADAKLNRIRSSLKFTCPGTIIPASYVQDSVAWQRMKSEADDRAKALRAAFGF